ncbi:protein-L-isoaspartate O-methyltransferase family protein [Salaquimonas pukyongi]|uniref:protein-L-isoaspartate O-methyltransferase family protein n=1 Tax=Salaquimonas pukyongi TaxID=2712698 RepID=UPI00096BCE78|nr:protein-L-isoaspartate O-methyltransferase [Salaquimonas pukyongi]
MLDFDTARQNMVDCQIRTSDVTNHELLEALSTVPRERFVPQEKAELAYIDEDVEIARGRYLMEPAPLAKLIQAAGVSKDDVVLDVGCGSGYTTAVLSRLASIVIAVEQDEGLAALATSTLSELDYDNAIVVQGDLRAGYPSEGPYDVIFLGGAVDEIPSGLFAQLSEGGKLLAVEGHGNAGVARLYMRNGSDFSGRSLFNCAIQPLPGFEKKPEFVF